MTDLSVLWRRLDRPGHEFCRLSRRDSLWHLEGTAVFAHEGMACRLEYGVVCGPEWQTLSGTVSGRIGREEIDVEISVDPGGRWRLDGRERPEVAGCVDLDLNFSPSTNLLPIRRLDLAVGGESEVRAAWLRFPAFNLEPLEQVYRRLGDRTYRYESGGGRFIAELDVNEHGLVTRYPGFCETDAGSP